MKKIILVIAAAAAICFTANAQFYVGGDLGLSFQANKQSVLGWSIAPTVGYQFNKTMAVGADIALGGDYLFSENQSADIFNFAIRPYYRWNFLSPGIFRFYLDGIVSLGSQTQTYTYKDYNGSEYSTYKRTEVLFSWGFAVSPVAAVEINKHWSVLSRLASIGINTVGNQGTTFGLFVLSSPTIGVEYKF